MRADGDLEGPDLLRRQGQVDRESAAYFADCIPGGARMKGKSLNETGPAGRVSKKGRHGAPLAPDAQQVLQSTRCCTITLWKGKVATLSSWTDGWHEN